jgi:hypothetical protein
LGICGLRRFACIGRASCEFRSKGQERLAVQQKISAIGL